MWEFPCCNRLASTEEVGGDYYGDDSEDFEDSDEDNRPPEYDFGVCFTEKHTTDPASVKYYGALWGDKQIREKGINYSGSNKNVRTCGMTGCGEQKKKPSKKKSS
ncbi:hypothetical protein FRC12_024178 [Ceratobasidium sp. 428]|nr:hypothetical protein FRC12_024178 [Ceratobasidium sp. 428]